MLSISERLEKIAASTDKIRQAKKEISDIRIKEQVVELLMSKKCGISVHHLLINLHSLESERRLLMQEVFALEEYIEDQLQIIESLTRIV